MQDRLSAVQFADNPEPRSPCCVIVDKSSSMIGGPIKAVNDALAQFKAEVSADTLASLRVEVSLVSFNHTVDYVDFRSVQDFQPPELSASGGTKIAPAINTALDLLDRRKREYRANGVSYYRPIALLLTDGQAEHDAPEDLAMVREKLVLEEEGRHIAFFAFGIGDADVEALLQITPPDRPPRHIGDVGNIAGLFKWLGNSVEMISETTPGDRLRLDPLEGYLAVGGVGAP